MFFNPSIEEIYNELCQDILLFKKGKIAKDIPTLKEALDRSPKLIDSLNKLKQFIIINRNNLDWKVYCGYTVKEYNFLKPSEIINKLIQNSTVVDFQTKINLSLTLSLESDELINKELLRSLKFIKEYCCYKCFEVKDYFFNPAAVSTIFRHISIGSLSPYFIASLPFKILKKLLLDDLLDESCEHYLKCSSLDFINNILIPKQKQINNFKDLSQFVSQIFPFK